MEKPALEGGNPVRDEFLPYATQWLTDDEISEVEDSLKSWIVSPK